MSWFGAFRNEYGFTWYGDKRTTVNFDFPLVTVTYLCVVLAVATLISTLGIRGRERWATTLRASYAVGLASVILVCLVGHNWLVGETEVKTHYLYRSDNYFRGSVGMRVALHGCNVTLEGYYTGVNGEGHVHYVESMKWTDYGKEQETVMPYLKKGLPHPVLTVLDFLSADGGGLRWGRSYHSSGYFAEALLWTAFAFWIISNVLLLSVVSYGAFMFLLTGVAMVLSCVVYHVCQPPNALRIHMGDSVLTVSYGWCFWLTLASGILTVILGAALFVCDHVFHEKVAEFFGLEKLDEDDLMDMGHWDPTYKHKDRASSLPYHVGYSRPGSASLVPPGAQQGMATRRKSSIFLEPERRPSDQSLRRGSLLFAAGGITNKGFEQERYGITKTNPLFGGASGSDIREEDGEDGGRMREVRVEVGGEEFHSPGHRKPSLAATKESRVRQSSFVLGTRGEMTTTAVVIEPPSDDNNEEDEESEDRIGALMSKGNVSGEGIDFHKGHDADSAFASAAPSPTGSEKNSSCGECEDIGH